VGGRGGVGGAGLEWGMVPGSEGADRDYPTRLKGIVVEKTGRDKGATDRPLARKRAFATAAAGERRLGPDKVGADETGGNGKVTEKNVTDLEKRGGKSGCAGTLRGGSTRSEYTKMKGSRKFKGGIQRKPEKKRKKDAG